MRSAVTLLFVLMTVACASRPVPATLDPRADACGSCRMIVADQHFASQIVAPYQEPRFFDDFGCLQRYLDRTPLPSGAVVFVADHRTGEWVAAESAVYSRLDAVAAPMGSHIIAHASLASRQADADAAFAVDVDRQTLFPPTPRRDRRP
jgi:copper chaperone NosL